MPILGIYASSMQPALNPASSFNSIATVTGTGSASSLTFSSVPGTYTHLQIRGFANVGSQDDIIIQFNSDTGANYSLQRVYANGASIGSGGFSGLSYAAGSGEIGGTTFANYYGGGVVDILDYASTSKYKTWNATAAANTGNADSWSGIFTGTWASTSAITSIKISSGSGNWNSNSHFALYGIKGA